MGDSHLKAHLYLSVQAEVFTRRERGTEQRWSKGVAKFSTHRQARSIATRPVLVRCASSWFSHPRFMVEGQQISFDHEGWSLYLLKLVPGILSQTCCSSTSYILVRVSTYRHHVKGMVGWVTTPHHSPPPRYTAAARGLRPGVVILPAGQNAPGSSHTRAPPPPAPGVSSQDRGGAHKTRSRPCGYHPGLLGLWTSAPVPQTTQLLSLSWRQVFPWGPLGWQLGL